MKMLIAINFIISIILFLICYCVFDENYHTSVKIITLLLGIYSLITGIRLIYSINKNKNE